MSQLTRVESGRITARRALALVALGAWLTAVSAQVCFYLPGNPVPVTLQVFAVVLCGMMLGSRLGLLSQLGYLAAGTAGLPVFAGFKSGPAVLFGPTGGYLVGFAAGCYLVGWIAERTDASFGARVLAGLSGVVVIYVVGRAWLGVWMGSGAGLTSWMLGVAPFVGVDVLKVLVASAISWRRTSLTRT